MGVFYWVGPHSSLCIHWHSLLQKARDDPQQMLLNAQNSRMMSNKYGWGGFFYSFVIFWPLCSRDPGALPSDFQPTQIDDSMQGPKVVVLLTCPVVLVITWVALEELGGFSDCTHWCLGDHVVLGTELGLATYKTCVLISVLPLWFSDLIL